MRTTEPMSLPPPPTTILPLFFSMRRPPPRSTLFPYTTLFRSHQLYRLSRNCSKYRQQLYQYHEKAVADTWNNLDRKSGSAGMPRPISYAVCCLKKKKQPLRGVEGERRDVNGFERGTVAHGGGG